MKCVREYFFSCRLRQSLFFVNLQTYTINSSDRVCGGVCFYKVQTFTINGSNKACDEVCFFRPLLRMAMPEFVADSLTELVFSLKL